jgi:hypothetical protein
MTETETPVSADDTVSSKPNAFRVPGSQFPVCTICGSDRIVRDAWASWQTDSRDWALEEIFDYIFCITCEQEALIEWRSEPLSKTERIRRLNDAVRRGSDGNGRIMITAGVQAMGSGFIDEARKAVAAFDSFSADNDPHGEHDFGAITIQNEKLFFKIDYYDLSLSAHSPDASDPQVTKRILTIMLASEY